MKDEANRIIKAAEKLGEEKGIEKGKEMAREEVVVEERQKTSKALVGMGLSYEEIEKTLGYDPRKYI